MLCRHFLQSVHDTIAGLRVERHELTCVSEPASGRWRIIAVVLSRQETTGQRAPDKDTNVMVLRERLELVFETSTDETVIHLARHISPHPQPLLKHDGRCRLPRH